MHVLLYGSGSRALTRMNVEDCVPVHAQLPATAAAFPHQAKQNASAGTNQQQPGGEASAQGQSTASLPVAAGITKADHQHPGAGGGNAGVAGGSAAGGGGAGAGDDGVDAGIDLSEEAYSAGADEPGARVLCAWLNANVATTFIEVHGDGGHVAHRPYS